jgi:hypothetical protein
MSDERFFSQVKATLGDYAPSVPGSVYTGMRRKLWLANFTRLSATRFNMWYALLLISIGSGVAAYHNMDETVAEKSMDTPISTIVALSTPTISVDGTHGCGVSSTPAECNIAVNADHGTGSCQRAKTTVVSTSSQSIRTEPQVETTMPAINNTSASDESRTGDTGQEVISNETLVKKEEPIKSTSGGTKGLKVPVWVDSSGKK